MSDKLVEPGEVIAPNIDLAGAVALAEKLYGIRVHNARQLDGYDDRNYHLKVIETPLNTYMTKLWTDGYVLKIMNSSDSKKLDFVEAQNEMMLHLDKHGIRTPQPNKNIHGNLYSIEKLYTREDCGDSRAGKEHVVRLLTYQEGTLLKDVPGSFELHKKVGIYTAKLDTILKSFYSPAYDHYSSLWMLRNVSKVREYVHVVKDERRKQMVEAVIREFEDRVLTQLHTMEAGMIHGDINEQNVLCGRRKYGEGEGEGERDGEEWGVTAILDLGDSHHSAYLLELALACTYMILLSGDLESARQVVSGYCSLMPLPRQHLALLKVCVCARLCQSLVLGLHSYSQHPENAYVLSTQSAGWSMLKTSWNADPDDFLPSQEVE